MGMYLPTVVRTNDAWPAEVVAAWASAPRPAAPRPTAVLSEGLRAVIAAISRQAQDPFQGARERRVMPQDMTIFDMEAHAARAAIARAGVDLGEIDLVLTCSHPAPYRLTNHACVLHETLGLPRHGIALSTEGAQHAFLLQLSIAHAMIAAGQARTALLVQSSALSRLVDYTQPISAVFGDGATATVVGAVEGDRGLLAASHYVDGERPHTLIASVPGAAWYDDGRAMLHLADPAGMSDILLRTVDLSTEGIHAALDRAGLSPRDVDFFCMHQGMPWLRELVQDGAGLTAATAVDTFTRTGHLFAAFVPSTLIAAEQDGVLRDGALVVISGGGNGMTYGATVLRWGRG